MFFLSIYFFPLRYCDQMLTDDIEIVCVDLLHDLVRFQDRAHQKDPIKAKMKKRLVFGLRETTRQVERGRVKAVVIAPNLEKCNEPGLSVFLTQIFLLFWCVSMMKNK